MLEGENDFIPNTWTDCSLQVCQALCEKCIHFTDGQEKEHIKSTITLLKDVVRLDIQIRVFICKPSVSAWRSWKHDKAKNPPLEHAQVYTYYSQLPLRELKVIKLMCICSWRIEAKGGLKSRNYSNSLGTIAEAFGISELFPFKPVDTPENPIQIVTRLNPSTGQF